MRRTVMTPEQREAKRVARNKRQRLYNSLVRRGFEPTWYGDGYRIRCSQCQAMCVNGIPIHEAGCPNDREEKEEDDD